MTRKIETVFCPDLLIWGYSLNGETLKESLIYFSEMEACIAARKAYPSDNVLITRDYEHSKHINETIPGFVFDYLRENWRQIPHDDTSLQKLINQNNWNELTLLGVTVKDLKNAIERLINE